MWSTKCLIASTSPFQIYFNCSLITLIILGLIIIISFCRSLILRHLINFFFNRFLRNRFINYIYTVLIALFFSLHFISLENVLLNFIYPAHYFPETSSEIINIYRFTFGTFRSDIIIYNV